MQEENKIAQLVFLKQNNFFSISKTFLFGQEKPDIKEKNSSIPVTLKIILGRQVCRPCLSRATSLSA
jgi:hypothetical protein